MIFVETRPARRLARRSVFVKNFFGWVDHPNDSHSGREVLIDAGANFRPRVVRTSDLNNKLGNRLDVAFRRTSNGAGVFRSKHHIHADKASWVPADDQADLRTGSAVDWTDGELQSGFNLQNPNVKRVCGCGESFDV